MTTQPRTFCMPPHLIDSHCHLDLEAFDDDRDDVITSARRAGVTRFVVPAVTASRWQPLLTLCRQRDDLHPALGLHPMFMHQHRPGDLHTLEPLLAQAGVVAVGECGLDFHLGREDAYTQKDILVAQLELAKALDLPVILHARKALQDVTQCLKAVGGLRGVLHSFSGSPEQARQLWDLGFHLGIGGVATYPRAKRLRRIVADMPAEWLLLETDSPDQPLCGHQGQRNEPARLTEVLACVSELRQQNPAELAIITRDNTVRLFDLPPDSTGLGT